ncbi:DUF2574 family protein [Escherichia coli]
MNKLESLPSSPVKGVTTEVVVAGSDSKRRIVLNRYD